MTWRWHALEVEALCQIMEIYKRLNYVWLKTSVHITSIYQPTNAHIISHKKLLLIEYELNCEYCDITLARNKAPWWWSDKIETCRSVLKCFKVFYVKLYVHSLVDKLKWFYENARCYNKIYRYTFEYLFYPPIYNWVVRMLFSLRDIRRSFYA